MEFIDEAKRYAAALTSGREKIVYDYLLANAVGSANAKPWRQIEAHLNSKKIYISKNTFQASIIKPSREGKIFIGSTDKGKKGYFIIASADHQEPGANTRL